MAAPLLGATALRWTGGLIRKFFGMDGMDGIEGMTRGTAQGIVTGSGKTGRTWKS